MTERRFIHRAALLSNAHSQWACLGRDKHKKKTAAEPDFYLIKEDCRIILMRQPFFSGPPGYPRQLIFKLSKMKTGCSGVSLKSYLNSIPKTISVRWRLPEYQSKTASELPQMLPSNLIFKSSNQTTAATLSSRGISGRNGSHGKRPAL